MANRFPIIVDTADNNKLKELPSGDNLNLSGSGIVNATTISTDSITLNGSNLNNFSGSWNDLTNKPTTVAGFGITDAFDGAYNSLTGRPVIPTTLTDLSITDGTSGQVLGTDGNGAFSFIDIDDISTRLENLTDVTIGGIQTNQTIKWNGVAFVNAFVDYNQLINKPTFVAQGDTLDGDLNGSVFADDSTLLVDAVDGSIKGNLRNGSIETNGAGGLTNITGNYINLTSSIATGTVTLSAEETDASIELRGTTNITGDLNITGRTDIKGSVFADDSSIIVDSINGQVLADVTGTNGTFTNIKGSLLTSGGAIIVDGSGAGSIPETVTVQKLDDFITDFKAAVAATTDLADFQSRVAALNYP